MKSDEKVTEQSSSVPTPKQPRAEFLERLRELREEIVASGVPLLTWEQLDKELSERRRYDEEDFDMKLENRPQEDNKDTATKLLSREEIFQRMREARARIVASGEKLLTSDEVLCEVAANRGRNEDDF